MKSRRRKKLNLRESLLHLFHPRRSNNHRPRVLHPEALFYFLLIVLGIFSLLKTIRFFPKARDIVLGYASSISSFQVVEKTNLEREKAGLKPLKVNKRLSEAALAKAQDMFDNQYWAHTSPNDKDPWFFIKEAGYVYKLAGENLARDFSNTPEMLSAWMASPTHRANIMNPNYQEIGIAVVDGKLQGFETTLVVQMFGTLKEGAESISAEAVSIKDYDQLTDRKFISADNQDYRPVLAGSIIPAGTLQGSPPLFSPLHLLKASFLSVIILIVLTLVYDALVIGHRRTTRLVGKNLAHIILFVTIAFLLIFFKGGMVE
jgi:hypothetical protein